MVVKKRSSSSNRWLYEHFRDKYVKESKIKNLCSRAWFKLQQINCKYKFLTPGMKIIDLGSSPGSWSKYAMQQIGPKGEIIACDILPMKNFSNITFIQGDLKDKFILNKLFNFCKDKIIHLVMSDMAPNITGISLIDLPKIIFLVELALSISNVILVKNGIFLVKLFYGEGFERILKKIYSLFLKVKICKPESSRTRSREVFILAIGLKN